MAKYKLDGIRNLNARDTITFASAIFAGINGNVNFTALAAQGTALEAARYAANPVVTDAETLEASLNTKRAERDPIIVALQALLFALGTACEGVAQGDLAKMTTVPFPIAPEPEPVGELGQLQDFKMTAGDEEQELDYQFDRDRNARGYELQLTTTPDVASSWVSQVLTHPTRSKGTLTGLPSGTKQYGRVRSIGGESGHSPWSDIASKRVP